MESTFIKNHEVIEEKSNVDDLFDLSELISNFSGFLDNIKNNSLVGLVGPYGSGKSTFLYQVQKKREDRECWINFDAWKFPERKDLWEGFVLDVADKLGILEKIQSQIEGRNTSSMVVDLVGTVSKKFFFDIDNILEAFKSPPAKRVFELQIILSQIINLQEKPVVFVIEDIDRSGDAGIYFLETLKNYLQKANLSKRALAIVPISNENYAKHPESYLKTLDYLEEFRPELIGFDKFVSAVFDENLFEGGYETGTDLQQQQTPKNHKKSQIITFLEELARIHSLNVRQIKSLLRGAEKRYKLLLEQGFFPDWRVSICIESTKYIKENGSKNKTEFENIRATKVISSSSVFAALFLAILYSRESIYDRNKTEKKIAYPATNVEFVTRKPMDNLAEYPSWPWVIKFMDQDYKPKEIFAICDFYLY